MLLAAALQMHYLLSSRQPRGLRGRVTTGVLQAQARAVTNARRILTGAHEA